MRAMSNRFSRSSIKASIQTRRIVSVSRPWPWPVPAAMPRLSNCCWSQAPDPNLASPTGETPLMVAARTGVVDGVVSFVGTWCRPVGSRELDGTDRVDVGGC